MLEGTAEAVVAVATLPPTARAARRAAEMSFFTVVVMPFGARDGAHRADRTATIGPPLRACDAVAAGRWSSGGGRLDLARSRCLRLVVEPRAP
ncbi:hypothetical protein Slu03_04670 [Sediminihabitans luteus]|nr:hypothetical protein Slu03_04670 [Sediminihabitans luteus]